MQKKRDTHHEDFQREIPPFPMEITFKAIYRNLPLLEEQLKNIFAENNLHPIISVKESSSCKFISYTFTSIFQSDDLLQKICREISSIEGFTIMF